MKLQNIFAACALSIVLMACTNMNRNGENTTPEGTTTSNSVNAEMEDNRIPAGADTIPSPGSNSRDLKEGGISNKGTVGQPKTTVSTPTSEVNPGKVTDKNMAGQEDTHGKKTQDGDNGAVK